MLILSQLIVRVWVLNPVPGREQVEMESVLAVGLIVHAIENRLVVANVVDRSELGCIQESPAPNAVSRQKISKLRAAETQAHAASGGTERPIVRLDVAKHLSRSQARTCSDLRHQAALVAKFRVWSSRGHLHALDGAGGQLRREYLALLIADRLSIDDETGLSVVTQRVEQSVAIRRHPAGAVGNRLAQSSAWIAGRKLQNQTSVHVDMGGRIVLQDIRSGCLYRDTGLASGNRQLRLDLNRDGIPHRDILRRGVKTRGRHFQVIRVGWNIGQPERTVRCRSRRLGISGDGIPDGHLSLRHRGAGLIRDIALDRSRIAERLCPRGRGAENDGNANQEKCRTRTSEYHNLTSSRKAVQKIRRATRADTPG